MNLLLGSRGIIMGMLLLLNNLYKMENNELFYNVFISDKLNDGVASSIIAYACRLSFLHGKDHFKGWLAFDVIEENENTQLKLMANYSKKYNAKRIDGETTMIIEPKDGKNLIKKHLKLKL